MVWGTYRSHLYFGLRNRHPLSPLFGMAWYKQPREEQITSLPMRHWCNLGDGAVYMWEDHDGASFGHQNITDGALGIETDWINHEHSWRAKVSVDGAENNTHAFIFYLAAQDLETRLEPLHQFDKSTKTYTVLRESPPCLGSSSWS